MLSIRRFPRLSPRWRTGVILPSGAALFIALFSIAVHANTPAPIEKNAVNGASSKAEQDKSLRDPTRPLTYTRKAEVASALQLQAIFERVSGYEAVINGRSVRVGQKVDNATITKITAERVHYEREGRHASVALRKNIFSTR